MARLQFYHIVKTLVISFLLSALALMVVILSDLYFHRLLPSLNINQVKSFQNDVKLQYFIQISDLHLSENLQNIDRRIHFEQFCKFISQLEVPPTAVVITGDLTSAKESQNDYNSHQMESEWIKYNEIISNELKGIPVLDLRGNHDTFGVGSDLAKENYFKIYGISGSNHTRTYMESIGNIDFLAIDMTPSPGFRQPYNFMGYLTIADEQELRHLLRLSQNERRIILGHYPLSLIETESGNDLTKILTGEIYMCGHLHTLLGRVNKMYAWHSDEKLLELELGDWKDERRFRLAAFVHNSFTFVDQNFQLDGSNLALLAIQSDDEFVQILTFSEISVEWIGVSINGLGEYKRMQLINQSKYRLKI